MVRNALLQIVIIRTGCGDFLNSTFYKVPLMSQEIAIATIRRDRTIITNQKFVAIAYQICSAIMTQNTSQMKVAIDATNVRTFSLLHCVVRAPASLHHRRIPIAVCFAPSSLPVG